MCEMGLTEKFGLGIRNQKYDICDAHIEFCNDKDMIITNALFSQPKRRRYTWTIPRGDNRY